MDIFLCDCYPFKHFMIHLYIYMLENYHYLLVQFYDGESHLCQLFKTIDDIAIELSVHRSTIYKNYDKKLNHFVIKKYKK